MHLGKDFWFIIKIFQILVEILRKLGMEENGDTPDGEV